MANQFTSAADLRTFLYAGDAVLTLQSERTGKHFTYRVSQATDRRTGRPEDRWFVSVLTDGDQWVYIGMTYPAERHRTNRLKMTTKSKCDAMSPCVLAFDWMLAGLQQDTIPPALVVRHEGRCGKCRRPLTRPDSIDRGIGPECAEQMGLVCDEV